MNTPGGPKLHDHGRASSHLAPAGHPPPSTARPLLQRLRATMKPPFWPFDRFKRRIAKRHAAVWNASPAGTSSGRASVAQAEPGGAQHEESSACPFVHGAELKLQDSPYAQMIALNIQSARFVLPGTSPAFFNRDMGELMSRDPFGEAAASGEPMSARAGPLADEEEDIKPPVISDSRLVLSPASIYARLPSENHFRLLEIRPGTDAEIQCRLHVCSIGANVGTYEAISYTWEPEPAHNSERPLHYERELNQSSRPAAPPGIQRVRCDGVDLDVSANLSMALARLRRPSTARMVWADAICINQHDVSERSRQVARMGDIFRNAHGVVVWLGPDQDAETVADVAARASSTAFAGICSVVSTWAEARGEGGPRPQYSIRGSVQTPRGKLPLSATSRTWLPIMDLYSRRWFSRLWVVQEMALARRATAIWGECEIACESIGLAASIIRTNWNRILPAQSSIIRDFYTAREQLNRRVPSGVMNAYFMYRICRLQTCFEPLRFSFCELLILTRQFGCQDERDKVFGLLGLPTTDDVGSCITPDYSRHLSDVYRDIASAMMRSAKPLAFLSHVRHCSILPDDVRLRCHPRPPPHDFSTSAPDAGPHPTLPSWVPRWHVVGPQALTPLGSHPAFAAGLSKPALIREPDRTGGHRLIVRGVILDVVKAQRSRPLQDYYRVFGMDPSLEGCVAKYRPTRQGLERLAMTLAAGKGWYGTAVADRAAVLSDLASCLVTRGLRWALEPGAFGWSEQDGQGGQTAQGFLNKNGQETPPAGSSISAEQLHEMSREGNGTLFLDAVATACDGRCLFTTASGMQGVGPLETKVGDEICVIHGTPTPFVIRRHAQGEDHELVGECYIDDVMHGEAVDASSGLGARCEETWIQLV